jgi:hypothetical protein
LTSVRYFVDILDVIPSIENNYAMKVALEYLLSRTDINPAVDNNMPIKLASPSGHSIIVVMLMKDQHVDPSDNYNVAYYTAVNNNHQQVADLLLHVQTEA